MTKTMNLTEIIDFIDDEYLSFVYKNMVWKHHQCLDKNLPQEVIRIIDEYQFDDEWWMDKFIEDAVNHWEQWHNEIEIGYNAYEYLIVRYGEININLDTTCKMLRVIQQYNEEFDESWSNMLMKDWATPVNLFNTYVYCHIKMMDLENIKELALKP